MASGHYHRRWSGSGASGSSAASSSLGGYKSLSSAVEPSTHGTSWNSVRWNKPSTAYRDHSSRIGSTFTSTKPSYALSSTADRYASSSRRAGDYHRPSLDTGHSSSSYANRRSSLQSTSATPRYMAPSLLLSSNTTSSNRYDSSNHYTPSYSSSRPTTHNYNSANYSSAVASALGKTERPWRTKLADSARMRAYGGDDVAPKRSSGRTTPRSRRNSANSSGDELSTAVAALKTYVVDSTASISSGRYRKTSSGTGGVPTISENIALQSADGDRRLPTNALRDYYLTKSYPPRLSPTHHSSHSPLSVSRSASRDFSSPTPISKKWSNTKDLEPKSTSLQSSRHSSRPASPNDPPIDGDKSPANAASSEVASAAITASPTGAGLSEVAKKAMDNDSSQEELSAAGSEKLKKRRLKKRTTLDKLSPSPNEKHSSSEDELKADAEEAKSRRRRHKAKRDHSTDEDASVAIAAVGEKKTTPTSSAPTSNLQRSAYDVDNGEDDVRTCLDGIEQSFVDTAQSLVSDIDKLVAEALVPHDNDSKLSTTKPKVDEKKTDKSSSVSLSEISKKDVENAAAKKKSEIAASPVTAAPKVTTADKPKTVKIPLKPKLSATAAKSVEKNDKPSAAKATDNIKNEDKTKTPLKVTEPAKKPEIKETKEPVKKVEENKQAATKLVDKQPIKAVFVAKKETKPLPPKEVNANMAFSRPSPDLHTERIVVERDKNECVISLREPSKPLVELFIDVSFQLMGDEEECMTNRGMARASTTHRDLIREPCKRLAVEPPVTALALVKKALVSPSSTHRAEITFKVAPKVLAELRAAAATDRVKTITEILRRSNAIGRAEIVVRSGNSKKSPLVARAELSVRKSQSRPDVRSAKGAGDLPWRKARGAAAVVDADGDLAAVDELARAEALLSSLAAWERDQQRRSDQQASEGGRSVPVPIAGQRGALPVDQRENKWSGGGPGQTAAPANKKKGQTNGGVVAGSGPAPSAPSGGLLLPAPVVRVLQPPRNKQRATITPSRSRVNSVDSQLSAAPSSTAGSVEKPAFRKPTTSLSEVDQTMLDLLTLGEQLSGSRGSLQTVRSEPPTKCMPLITPAYKSTRAMLFDNIDESLPLPAVHQQRKGSIASTISNTSVFSTASSDFQENEPSVGNLPRRTNSNKFPEAARPSWARRGSNGSGRTVPAAPATRTERYAAHIPIRDAEADTGYGLMAQLTPSRQSLTSVDSFATAATGGSGTQLDAAAKQVERMINEAKYRHRQHRSKFKEAIDYLDQIYEDIRKECDQFPKEISDAIQRTEKTSKYTHQQPPPIPPAPVNYMPLDQLSEYEDRMLAPPETMAQNRLSGDRLDFTRKWLDDDIKSWSNINPKPDLLVPCDQPSLDMDERSVGSASAEVAAINERDGNKPRRLPHQAPDLIPRAEVVAKAAPVRRDSNQSSTDSARNLIGRAIEKTQQTKKLDAHRLSFPNNGNGRPRSPPATMVTKSGNVIQKRSPDTNKRSPPQKIHRAFDQYDYLPYQQQKTVSEDYYGRVAGGSAAVVRGVGGSSGSSSNRHKPVGSVHSLPDSALIRPKAVRAVPQQPAHQQPAHQQPAHHQPAHHQPAHQQQPSLHPDHLLTLDNLVAELDLNTDDMVSSTEMRQSFPTAGIHREDDMLAVAADYDHNQNPMSSSYDRGLKKAQRQQQRTLDEATNLLNAVAGEYGTRSAGEVMSPYFEKVTHAPQQLGNGKTVENRRTVFESKNTEQPSWRRNAAPTVAAAPMRRPSIPKEDEENYYEIGDLLKEYPRHTSLGELSSVGSFTPSSPRSTYKASECYPPVPISSPPSRPPEKMFSPPSSSQDLDYDDDCNYDNIQAPPRGRVSQRSSPPRSAMSHQLAPNPNMSKSQAGAKLSQLLRKIGGGNSRPPQPASSMIALHKTSHEQSPHPALYKSNSVGYEPWANEVMMSPSNEPTPPPDNGKKPGFGKRLKQSLFGSSKRK